MCGSPKDAKPTGVFDAFAGRLSDTSDEQGASSQELPVRSSSQGSDRKPLPWKPWRPSTLRQSSAQTSHLKPGHHTKTTARGRVLPRAKSDPIPAHWKRGGRGQPQSYTAQIPPKARSDSTIRSSTSSYWTKQDEGDKRTKQQRHNNRFNRNWRNKGRRDIPDRTPLRGMPETWCRGDQDSSSRNTSRKNKPGYRRIVSDSEMMRSRARKQKLENKPQFRRAVTQWSSNSGSGMSSCSEDDDSRRPGSESETVGDLAKHIRKDWEYTIFVKGLHYHVTADDLKAYFGSCGRIVNLWLPRERLRNRIKRLAWIEFSSPDSANKALLMDKASLPKYPGKKLRVEMATKGYNSGTWKRGPAT